MEGIMSGHTKMHLQEFPSVSKSSEHLKRLEILTEELAPTMAGKMSRAFTVKEVNAEKGTCFTFGLMKKKEVAVVKAFASSGTVLAQRSHEEKEYIVVVTGQLRMTLPDKVKLLSPGDAIAIDAGISHKVQFLEDTWTIAVTIPAAREYPEENQRK